MKHAYKAMRKQQLGDMARREGLPLQAPTIRTAKAIVFAMENRAFAMHFPR